MKPLPVKPAAAGALGAGLALALAASWPQWNAPGAPDAPDVPAQARRTLPSMPGVTAPAGGGAVASPAAPAPAPAPSLALPLNLSTAPLVQVGEHGELAVTVGPGSDITTIAFTVRFDPDLVQARAAAPAPGSAQPGAEAAFSVETSEAGDRMRIVSAVSALRGAALQLQFEAIAPGATTLRLTDATATDRHGTVLALRLPVATVPLTVLAPAAAVPHAAPPNPAEAPDHGD